MDKRWEEISKSINEVFYTELEKIEKCPIAVNEIVKNPIEFILNMRENLIIKLYNILNKEEEK